MHGIRPEGETVTRIETTANVGSSLPDIVLPRLEGEELRLRELQGKRLLLFFWGSW